MCRGALSVFLALMACGIFACSGGDAERPIGAVDAPPVTVADPDAGPTASGDAGEVACVSAAKRDCVIDRGTFMGIHDCAQGTQACENGQWGPCLEF